MPHYVNIASGSFFLAWIFALWRWLTKAMTEKTECITAEGLGVVAFACWVPSLSPAVLWARVALTHWMMLLQFIL